MERIDAARGPTSTRPGHPRRRRTADRPRLWTLPSVGRSVLLFMVAGLGAFVLCGVGLTLISEDVV